MPTLKQLCCPCLIAAFVFACLAFIAWALCIVAALDREAEEGEQGD